MIQYRRIRPCADIGAMDFMFEGKVLCPYAVARQVATELYILCCQTGGNGVVHVVQPDGSSRVIEVKCVRKRRTESQSSIEEVFSGSVLETIREIHKRTSKLFHCTLP